MRRKILAVVGAGAILLSLTACGTDSIEQVKQEKAFTQACHDAGGKTYRDGLFFNLHCQLPTDYDNN
jgi:hypothetical protein